MILFFANARIILIYTFYYHFGFPIQNISTLLWQIPNPNTFSLELVSIDTTACQLYPRCISIICALLLLTNVFHPYKDKIFFIYEEVGLDLTGFHLQLLNLWTWGESNTPSVRPCIPTSEEKVLSIGLLWLTDTPKLPTS